MWQFHLRSVAFWAFAGCSGANQQAFPVDGATTSSPDAPASTSPDAPTSWSRDWAANPAVYEQTGASRLWAVSDVHGDIDRLVALLAGGGVAGGTATAPTWTAGTDTLVVNGDNIDKGEDSIDVLDYWMKLIPLAAAAGGHIVVLVGNHEVEFLDDPTNSKAATLDAEIAQDVPAETPAKFADPNIDPHGRFLHERPIAAVVDGWFFSHSGNSGGMTASAIAVQYQTLVDQESWGDPFFLDPNSILEAKNWWPSSGTTAFLDSYLGAIPARHIVFGHSPPTFSSTPSGDIEARYYGRLLLIDVGMSSAVNNSLGKLLRVDNPGTTAEVASQVNPAGKVTALNLAH